MKLPDRVPTEDRAVAWNESRVALAFNILWEQYQQGGFAKFIVPKIAAAIEACWDSMHDDPSADTIAEAVAHDLFADLNKSVSAVDGWDEDANSPWAVAADMVEATRPVTPEDAGLGFLPGKEHRRPLTPYQQGVVDALAGDQPATSEGDYVDGYMKGTQDKEKIAAFTQPHVGKIAPPEDVITIAGPPEGGTVKGPYDDAYGASNPAGL